MFCPEDWEVGVRSAIDLSTFRPFTLYIEDGKRAIVQTIVDDDLTVEGDDDKLVFTPAASTVSSVRDLRFSLRKDPTNGAVIAGTFEMKYLPGAA